MSIRPRLRNDPILILIRPPLGPPNIVAQYRSHWENQQDLARALNIEFLFQLPLTWTKLCEHSNWLYLIETDLVALWNWPILRRQACSFPLRNLYARGEGFCLRSRDLLEASRFDTPVPISPSELRMSGLRINVPIAEWDDILKQARVLFADQHKHLDHTKNNPFCSTTLPSDLAQFIAHYQQLQCTSLCEIRNDGEWRAAWAIDRQLGTEKNCFIPNFTFLGLNLRPAVSQAHHNLATQCLLRQIPYKLIYDVNTTFPEIYLDKVECLVIDSWKCYAHLWRELTTHQGKVTKMIWICGDCKAEWAEKQPPNELSDLAIQYNYSILDMMRGIGPVIDLFLLTYPEWSRREIDSLTILVRSLSG